MVGVNVYVAGITSIVKFIGADWNADQIFECAELAYQECYWFSLAELKHFIVRIKTGVYRSHKNFSPSVFMEFLQEYSGEALAGRGEYYGQAKPAPRRKQILSIDPLRGKSRKVALWILEQVAETRNKAMEQMRALTESMCSEQREFEDRERQEIVDQYQEKLKKLLATNNEEVKRLMSQGLSLDEAVKQILNLK